MIFVGATNLIRRPRGIVAGKETAIACENATNLQNRILHDHVLLVTAGETTFVDAEGREKVWMAKIMRDYILKFNPAAPVRICCARIFHTTGEMDALAQYCWYAQVEEVVLVVKKSQRLRMKLLCRHWLKHYNRANVRVRVESYRNEASWFVYELLALVRNVAEMGGRKVLWAKELTRELLAIP